MRGKRGDGKRKDGLERVGEWREWKGVGWKEKRVERICKQTGKSE